MQRPGFTTYGLSMLLDVYHAAQCKERTFYSVRERAVDTRPLDTVHRRTLPTTPTNPAFCAFVTGMTNGVDGRGRDVGAVVLPAGCLGQGGWLMSRYDLFVEYLQELAAPTLPDGRPAPRPRRRRGDMRLSSRAPNRLPSALAMQARLGLKGDLNTEARKATEAWARYASIYRENAEVLKALTLKYNNTISLEHFLSWVTHMLENKPLRPQLEVCTVKSYISAFLSFWAAEGVVFHPDARHRADQRIETLIHEGRTKHVELPLYNGAAAILPGHLSALFEAMPPGIPDYHELRSIFSLAMASGRRTCTGLHWEDIEVQYHRAGDVSVNLRFRNTLPVTDDPPTCYIAGNPRLGGETFPLMLLQYMREVLGDPHATLSDLNKLTGRVWCRKESHYSRRLRQVATMTGYPARIKLTMQGFRAGTQFFQGVDGCCVLWPVTCTCGLR